MIKPLFLGIFVCSLIGLTGCVCDEHRHHDGYDHDYDHHGYGHPEGEVYIHS